MALVECRECEAEVSSQAETCPRCGAPHPAPPPEPEEGAGTEEAGEGAAGSGEATLTPEEAYYREVFRRFDRNLGRYEATWNWAAFLFGPFWYLAKGLWLKALLMLGILLLTGGLAFVLVWVYCGAFGNWDYYLLRRQGKQFY